MAKVKISEFNSNPALNTDIDSINIAEGCSPSGINDAIRELMSQLKDWQSGTSNDPMVIGSSGSLTLNQGTANGVTYLNGSKVVTSGSALTFDGTRFLVGKNSSDANNWGIQNYSTASAYASGIQLTYGGVGAAGVWVPAGSALAFGADGASGTTELMRLTSTGLGIGTSSPAAKLDAFQSSVGTYFLGGGGDNKARQLAITSSTTTNSGDTHTLNAQSGTGVLAFAISSSEKMRLDTSGNLGLGVTPSASSFTTMQIRNASLSGWVSDTSAMFLTANASFDGTNFRYISTNFANQYRQQAGTHYWYNAPSGTAGNAISFTQAMTLDASGNFLVGTTSNPDTARLHVTKSSGEVARFSSPNGTSSYITLGRSDTAGEGFQFGYSSSTGDCTITASIVTHPIIFKQSTSERARIDSSGNLLVGTTSQISADKVGIKYTGATNNGLTLSDTQASGDAVRFFANTSTQVGSITHTSSATAYNTSSDYRLKNTIAPMTDALAKVAQLKPVTYKWNVDGSDGQGFIAHELQAVVPDAVVGEKDAVNEDGSIKPQGIDTSFLVATLTAALQELNAKFDAYVASHP